ncbi:MAG: hypothetical protein LBG77_03355, partial [Dysgonamonadaceae bacterium]|nr:hypothetical protein [Dysgonamonadaceae bacterium]
MKNIVSRVKNSIILIAFMWSSVSLQAQVNIGSTKDPHEGAVLDLSQASGANGKGLGFLLPRVALNDANQWQIAGSSTNATGMMIYNTNANVVDGNGEGIYIWDGKIWSPVHSPSLSADVPLTAFDVTPAVTKIDVAIGASQKFSISNIIPNNASYPGVKWSITSGQSFVQI